MPYLLVIIRDSWAEISQKARFVAKTFGANSNVNILHIVRKDGDRFREQWRPGKVELSTSTSGVLFSYLLIMLKSPRDVHDRILRRLLKREPGYTLVTEGFISVISKTLNHYFAATARSDKILPFLRNMNMPKIFLIDEFTSIKTLDLKLLKQMGLVVYVSQDVASENFDFRVNSISRCLMYKLELDVLRIADLVIACSERDQLRYLEMGAKSVVFYPNIYPNKEFEPCLKEDEPRICISFQSRWGKKGIEDFYSIFEALSKIGEKIKVCAIGVKPQRVPGNIELEYYKYIPSKLDYMRILSKSWIGINIGIHKGGSNERKYDYAMAGLVVFSDIFGCRGDLLPHEYTYLDNNDLAAKLGQLVKLGQEKIIEMGIENRKQALSLAEEQLDIISKSIKVLLSIRKDS
jgi:glycosyltransferase involved in cell wall biosynthesis